MALSRAKRSEGGPNDFYSNGDYWWPDPAKPDGLPYIQRDGQTNPDNFNHHRLAVRQLRDAVAALGAAGKITGEKRYAGKAAELLNVFFLDPATRMNPHLNFAQAIPGVSSGRGIRQAAAYTQPFLADKSKWPLKPDVRHGRGGPHGSRPCSLRAWRSMSRSSSGCGKSSDRIPPMMKCNAASPSPSRCYG